MPDDATRPLEELEEEERAISKRRRRLHDRIEFLAGSGMGEPDAEERLALLVEEEREVSRHRRELHLLIDARRSGSGVEVPRPEPSDSHVEKPADTGWG
jgi:hypothetical protein